MLDEILNTIQNPEGKDVQSVTNTPSTTEQIITEPVTNTTTIAPEYMYSSPLYHPTFTADEKARAKGATVEAPDKNIPLFDLNTGYLTNITNAINEKNLDYITTAFTTVGKLPVINGKEVQIGEISIYMKDPKNQKFLMDEASKIETDPNIDIDTKIKLINNSIDAINYSGILAAQSKKFWKSVSDQAIATDIKNNSNYDRGHQFLIKDDLTGFMSPDEYAVKFINNQNKIFNEAIDAAKSNLANRTVSNNINRISNIQGREASESTAAGIFYRSPLGPAGLPSGIRSAATTNAIPPVDWDKIVSQYEYRPDVTLKNIKKNPQYNYVLEIYNRNKQRIINDYNNPKSNYAYKLKADLEGKFKDNKGGERQYINGTISFDMAAPNMAYNKKIIRSPEVKDLLALDGIIAAQLGNNPTSQVIDNGIKIAAGGIDGSDPKDISSVPEELQNLFRLVHEDLYTGHGKGSTLLPKGTITFQAASSGKEDYHAYNIKFNPTYLSHEKFTSKNNKEILKTYPEILKDGITIYIPKNISSRVTRLGNNALESSETSSTEGLFSIMNKVDYYIPGAGYTSLQLDKNSGQIVQSGWVGVMNGNTNSLDTFPMPVMRYPYNQAIVLDSLLGDWKKNIFNLLRENDSVKTAIKQQRGAVHDPNKLLNK